MRSVGVEEEYGLINADTRELMPVAKQVRTRAERFLGDDVQHEFKASQIEMATPVCRTLDDVEREIRKARVHLSRAARQLGARLIAAGTHPFSRPDQQPVTPTQRYRDIASTYRELTNEFEIFGCHVHVGVDDPERAIAILDRARSRLVPLIALSANSPYWEGRDTGYASYRTEVWSRWPLSGVPGAFETRRAYEQLVSDLLASGALDDETKIYWDIRPSARFPTIEFRAMDVCATVDEAVAMAGLVRALVDTCAREVVESHPQNPVRYERIRLAHWLAARDGLDGELVDLALNALRPAHDVVRSWVDGLREALRSNGDLERVESTLDRMVHEGNGAQRQRRAFARGRSMRAVVDHLVKETLGERQE
ncbi:MAG: glutamate--cysteine ligase [Candidatus Eremiobacteraeota bacterium]|nr:glutamate--cysteine ligase [Candidatus Eremiobacteraeota bacterium]